jgi:hypothetical protein
MTDERIGFRVKCESCEWYRERCSKRLAERFGKIHEDMRSRVGDEHHTTVERFEDGFNDGK